MLPAVGLFALLAAAPPTIDVRIDPALNVGKPEGRVLVTFAKPGGRQEPRQLIGETDPGTPPVVGTDAVPTLPGDAIAHLDAKCQCFPANALTELPAGDYLVQAILHRNPDLNHPNAPGDLYGKPVKVTLPNADGAVQLTLDQTESLDEMPKDTADLKYLKFPSKLLSDFYGRPMFLRVGLRLPPNYESEPMRKYPLRVHIGGYGQRFTDIRGVGRTGDPILTIFLDGAGPYGDPYQVNSASTGPYGDAVVKELIPHVEATYRGIGTGQARFTDGHSTGGWVSFALQVFYPDEFNGCWSGAPDPVDFRAYELIDIYKDTNAYVNRFGFERPAKRLVSGETIYTVRHECQVERVLGRGDRWELSGKDWCAWNATFGPRAADGRPKPLWDGATGAIDRSVVDHWKQYDLRRRISENWPSLSKSLRGKIHIHVGDADDYFLNNAVRLLDAELKKLSPPAEASITFVPVTGHSVSVMTEKQKVAAMLAR